MSFSPHKLLCLSVLVVVAASVLVGCGPDRPETIPVTGTVTLDGKPVAGAAVLLMPEAAGRPATAETDESGSFSVMTFEPGDGALPGKHAVTVTKKKVTGMLADKDGLSGSIAPGGIQVEWLLPQKYSDPKTSGLTVEVKDDMDPLNLELKSD